MSELLDGARMVYEESKEDCKFRSKKNVCKIDDMGDQCEFRICPHTGGALLRDMDLRHAEVLALCVEAKP